MEDEELKYIEIHEMREFISKNMPEITLLKHWNKYSIQWYTNKKRFAIVRRPNFWYKLRTTFLVPLIFIPYCFYYGYVNVKGAIRGCYKGAWTVAQCLDEKKYDEIKGLLVKDGVDGIC